MLPPWLVVMRDTLVVIMTLLGIVILFVLTTKASR